MRSYTPTRSCCSPTTSQRSTLRKRFTAAVGDGSDYEPFGGIVLTDTFNLHTERTGFPREWLPDNSERAERQQRPADPGRSSAIHALVRRAEEFAADDNPKRGLSQSWKQRID